MIYRVADVQQSVAETILILDEIKLWIFNLINYIFFVAGRNFSPRGIFVMSSN